MQNVIYYCDLCNLTSHEEHTTMIIIDCITGVLLFEFVAYLTLSDVSTFQPDSLGGKCRIDRRLRYIVNSKVCDLSCTLDNFAFESLRLPLLLLFSKNIQLSLDGDVLSVL